MSTLQSPCPYCGAPEGTGHDATCFDNLAYDALTNPKTELPMTNYCAQCGVMEGMEHRLFCIHHVTPIKPEAKKKDLTMTENQDTVSALDTQVSGAHYKNLAIQPVEYIHANKLGYFEGNVVKYVTRWKTKGGITDLEKARHYIDLLIELDQKEAIAGKEK